MLDNDILYTTKSGDLQGWEAKIVNQDETHVTLHFDIDNSTRTYLHSEITAF